MKFLKKAGLLLFLFLLTLGLSSEVHAMGKGTVKALSAPKAVSRSKKAQKKDPVITSFLRLMKQQKAAQKKHAAAVQKALQKQEMTILKKQISSYLKTNGLNPGSWGIYVKNLNTSQSIAINGRRFTAASTIKLYAMAAAYDKIQKGQLSLTSTLSSLLYNMIVYSDNDSFNYLVYDHIGSDSLNQFMQTQGFSNTAQFHALGPGSHPAIGRGTGPANYTSAADCGRLLEKIYRGTLVSKSHSSQMLNLLKNQTYRWKIPSGIPSGVVTANKTGECPNVGSINLEHDTAIVYGPKTPYVICIFSESSQSQASRIQHIRNISSLVYQYLNN